MGYPRDRFENQHDIDDDFICVICLGVLEDPVYFLKYEHTFCRKCINVAMKRKSECPMDRIKQSEQELRPALRYFKKDINKLRFVIAQIIPLHFKLNVTGSNVQLMDVKLFALWKILKITKKNVSIKNVLPVDCCLLLL